MLALDLRWALDPVCFSSEALGIIPDPWQAEVLRSQEKRLLMNCARQTGKSTTAGILALHTALYQDGSLILLVSPSLRQSSELFRRVAEFMSRLDLPPPLLEDNRLSCELENRSRIVSLPSSEGKIRGYSGVDLIIEDEAARVPDELYGAVRPMLAVSGGKLILMSTPWGKRGHFFEAWTQGGEVWERVRVKAEECPRIDPAFLEEERAALGDWMFLQEYGCEFMESEDSLFSYAFVQGLHDESIQPLFPVRR